MPPDDSTLKRAKAAPKRMVHATRPTFSYARHWRKRGSANRLHRSIGTAPQPNGRPKNFRAFSEQIFRANLRASSPVK